MTDPKKPGRLRWKKHARETGLRAVVAGPRGSDYTDGVTVYAKVQAHHRLRGEGWFWYSSAGGEHRNTSNDPAPDEATAKRQAQEYVKAQLAKGSHD
jgi:hypothetical protein